MDINVGITLNNQSAQGVTVRIPAGSIFEAGKTSYGVQNVAVAKDYTFKVPPYSQVKVVVVGRCLNQSRGVPRSVPGRATPFRYAGGSFNQSSIWQTASNPRSK
jgi:hypothetical protein